MTNPWISRGKEGSGFVQDSPHGQTPSPPALATHQGELWCLWSDHQGDLFFAIGDNSTFEPRVQFPDFGIPVLAELLGTLHAVIVRPSGEMAHYIFDDGERAWGRPSILDLRQGFTTQSPPTLVSYHNKLVLAYLRDGSLTYSIWTWIPHNRDHISEWSNPKEVAGGKKFKGIPALFVLNGILHVLCQADDKSGDIDGFAYHPTDDTWEECDDVSEGKAATGVSAATYGDSAYLAFQEKGPHHTSGLIFISEYKDGKWSPHEAVVGQSSSDPPQLAVLHGRINCIFNSADGTKDLRWYSRSLLGFSLDSWMGNLPDNKLLSDMTIPGTHDSCAQSNIPFVRTQYLSVAKQMEAGLRFLDMRLRVHSDGELYCYHGGIAIDFPVYLKFDKVMNGVFKFFEKSGKAPTETVLVSINNDDVSGKEPPAVFYDAVKRHIDRWPKYEDGSSRWITSRTTVTLGEARGKAVLLRRYHPDPALDHTERIGIDLSGWQNNNPDFTLTTPDGVTITLQDKWQYSDKIPLVELVKSKFEFVSHMLRKAASSPPEHWFLNFASAVGVPTQHGEIAESHWIAAGAHSHIVGKFVPGMNAMLRKKFEWNIKTRYGILAKDYPELPKDSDLIAYVIGTNM